MDIVFSHGFGVRQDDRGLFTGIAAGLGTSHQYHMFDYNEFDAETNTLTVPALSDQAQKLKSQVASLRDYMIICHSQGSVVAALAKLPSKLVIMLAPPLESNSERLKRVFASRPGAVYDPDGLSTLPRRDGTTTLIPSDYWHEKAGLKPAELYRHLAETTRVVIIAAEQDDVLTNKDYASLKGSRIEVNYLPADHNFSGPARQPLVDLLANLIAG